MGKPTHIAVLRFSSLGDVALLYPVVRFIGLSHPEVKIHLVSAPFHQAIFEDCPNVNFIPFHKEKGVFNLFTHLKGLKVDAVVDAHNVIRTWMLRALFSLSNTPFVHLNKERSKRNNLLKYGWKKATPIPQVSYRYAALFQRVGIDTSSFKTSSALYKPKAKDISGLLNFEKRGPWIAIAPFTKHLSKVYPHAQMQQLIALLLEPGLFEKIFIIGAQHELRYAKEHWEVLKSSHIASIPPHLSFKDELDVLSHMDIVVSMDSANMHLASMFGISVLSIWGGTHPHMGFYGFGQKASYAIQSQDEDRPCTVFGKSPCGKKNCPHFTDILPQNILEKIQVMVSNISLR